MTEVLEAPKVAAEPWTMPMYNWPIVLVKNDTGKHTQWAPAVVQKVCEDCLEVSKLGYQWANLMPMTVYHISDPRLKDPERRRCLIQMEDETGVFKLHPQFELLDQTIMGLNSDMKQVFTDLYETDKKGGK